jgi:hypothetical protein
MISSHAILYILRGLNSSNFVLTVRLFTGHLFTDVLLLYVFGLKHQFFFLRGDEEGAERGMIGESFKVLQNGFAQLWCESSRVLCASYTLLGTFER